MTVEVIDLFKLLAQKGALDQSQSMSPPPVDLRTILALNEAGFQMSFVEFATQPSRPSSDEVSIFGGRTELSDEEMDRFNEKIDAILAENREPPRLVVISGDENL